MSLTKAPFTFLQVSDVHLDSKLASRQLNLPAKKREERSREILDALIRALAIAYELSVDAVLLPGDLWDSESVTTRTINRLMEVLGNLANIPVIIAPGNHDFCSNDSLYSDTVLAARGMRSWPDNVHIFKSPQFSIYKHPRHPEVSFTGRAFIQNVPVSERLLAGAVPKDLDAEINILLFHGSLDGYKGGDSGWPGKLTAPFSAAELAHLGFTYAAIGHYHDCNEIKMDADNEPLLGAYSGCLAGRSFDESGPRYLLLGTIAYNNDGKYADKHKYTCTLEKIEVDTRRFISCTCNITDLTSSNVLALIEANLEKAGARRNSDIVRVLLEGRHPTGGEPIYVADHLNGLYYHAVVEDETRPDYHIDEFDERTTEGKFVQAMLVLKHKAESTGGTINDVASALPLTVKHIEDALYYGLDALKQKKVTVRHVD